MAAEVLVAGGTGALGAAVVKELVNRGHPVGATWLVERERERLEGLEGVELIKADLFDPQEASSAVAAISDLGAVVNLVGGYAEGGRMHETDPDEFDRLMRLNLRPNVLLARAAIPRFLRTGGGAFVAVSARPALRPFPGAAPYIVSKAAVLSPERDQGQRDPPERHRHPGQPGVTAGCRPLEVGRTGSDRKGGPLPDLGRVGADERGSGPRLRQGLAQLDLGARAHPQPQG
jgi:hypothetical protein